jgi:hypothetical protein
MEALLKEIASLREQLKAREAQDATLRQIQEQLNKLTKSSDS